MKTSILVSSFAAFCLLLTFAEAPRRNGGDKINIAFTTNTVIPAMERATMLPGVFITADRKKESSVTVPVIPTEDFRYLEFDVTEYGDAINTYPAEVLPEATEIDFSYLKFEIDDYISESESTGNELTELPLNEITSYVSTPGPAANVFDYLRFDINDYISNSLTEDAGIGILPSEDNKTLIPAETAIPDELKIEFGYLKFDVTKYYESAGPGSGEQFELPEE